jgi:polysaccharide deacetylase family protein (PEP-CTERM system associated)
VGICVVGRHRRTVTATANWIRGAWQDDPDLVANLPSAMSSARPALLLSVDFEDWHQLVRRRVGASNWREAGPALARQTNALLTLLDELDARATFFVLGMAARAHPQLLEPIAAAGHEIGCHGDAHLPVHTQTPEEFAADLRAARATIEGLTGRTPIGYRAPAFSITANASWAYDVLAQEGFAYDASQHDSPAIRDRAVPATSAPHRIQAGLWEFPVAVWQTGWATVPVGGASYWTVLPTRLVVKGLYEVGPLAGLYLHPYELDPQRLRAMLPQAATPAQRVHARLREAQRNGARRRAPGVLKAIARRYDLIPYGDAHARLGERP